MTHEEELQTTVEDLVSALSDELKHMQRSSYNSSSTIQSILESLTRLSLSNSKLQSVVGHAMVDLWTNLAPCLYYSELSTPTLMLLAASTYMNQFNQKMVLQAVQGFSIPSKGPSGMVLYVISVPDIVRKKWKAWKARRKELIGHRIPSGAPPQEVGIPAPCLCDSCLGKDQFLPTWKSHFNDLTRWIDDNEPTKPVDISFKSFLLAQLTLNQFQIERCVSSLFSSAKIPCILYAIHPILTGDALARSKIAICPTQDVMAIEIFDLEDSPQGRHSSIVQQPERTPASNPAEVYDAKLEDQMILIFDSTRTLESCCARIEKETSNQCQSNGLAGYLHLLHEIFQGLDVNGDGSIKKDEFIFAISSHATLRHQLAIAFQDVNVDANEDIVETIFNQIGDFQSAELHWDDIISRFGNPMNAARATRNSDINEIAACIESIISQICTEESQVTLDYYPYAIQIFADILQQELHIKASYDQKTFTARIPKRNLTLVTSTKHALLQISQDSIEKILRLCIVCQQADYCSKTHAHASCIRLRENSSVGTAIVQLHPVPNDELNCLMPVRGLNGKGLKRLNAIIGRIQATYKKMGKSIDFSKELVTLSLTNSNRSLLDLIHLCNARQKKLSQSEEPQQSTYNLRNAGRYRCMHIRNLLLESVQLIHYCQLGDMTFENCEKILKKLLEILRQALAINEHFHPWEKNNPRIKQLHLSNPVWSNGNPDASYFTEMNQLTEQHMKNRKNMKNMIHKRMMERLEEEN